MHGTVMIVEDDEDAAMLLREGLAKRGYTVRAVHSAEACLEALAHAPVDVVVTDVNLGAMSGIELCGELQQRFPSLLTIVVTGAGGLETAIAAIRAGAFDFVTKPVRLDLLGIAVARSMETIAMKREVIRLREATNVAASTGIAGNSPAILKTIDMIERVASGDATILITGESGTGKELVARALHDKSARKQHPFIAVNCAAMPGPLLESELFGHVRGAFTDANTTRTGLFVQAGAGTIFLDEIGEMPLEMQVKLLRVLQERRVRPVGGDTEVAIAARVVTATNRDLDIEVAEKRFREDLYYRINVVPIAVPPLRERPEDILALAQLFITRAAARTKKLVRGISAPAARRMRDYDWPGNVRELENAIERAVALCRLEDLTVDDLPARLNSYSEAKAEISTASPTDLITVDEMARRYVRQVLSVMNGNKTKAAKVLGIDRRSLYRRLETLEPAADKVEPPSE